MGRKGRILSGAITSEIVNGIFHFRAGAGSM